MSNSRGFLTALPLAIMVCSTAAAMAEPSVTRQKELIHLVRQDCGACHGMTLKGGLGPALLPETLAGKPVESLVATIISGRPGTPMPPWQHFLSNDEVQWIVVNLLAGFPE